jgi:NADH-quinone oxidoreductase subunit J
VIEAFIFYFFGAVLLGAAIGVIASRNPVHSAMFLVLSFFTSAFIWLLLEAEFLAIVLVLVYVGAVMVLFLFVVMMLDIDIAALRGQFIRYLPIGVLIAAAMVVNLFLVLGPSNFGLELFAKPEGHPAGYSNTAELGLDLYTTFLYPFEIAAVILLVAIVAAIRLTLRRRPETKHQDASRQVRVKKGPDRIRLVSMPAEPRVTKLATPDAEDAE